MRPDHAAPDLAEAGAGRGSVPAPSRVGPAWWPWRRGGAELGLGAAGIVTFLVVWHGLVTFEVVSPLSVPKPAVVIQRIGDLAGGGEFLSALRNTMWTWFAALVVTSAVAIPVGLLVGWFAALQRPTSTVVHAGRSIPSTALIPIAILFFGLGTMMKFSLVAYAIFWPLILNASYGVRSVDPVMLMVGRSLGWRTVAVIRRLVLPAALPSIATGIRVAGSIALIVVLSAELLGAQNGVGTVLVTYQQAERPDYVYAGIIVVGAIGVAVHYGLSYLERWLLPWVPANRR